MKASNLLFAMFVALAFSACKKDEVTAANNATPAAPAVTPPATAPVEALDSLIKHAGDEGVNMQAEAGKREGTSLVSTGGAGFLMFGPYVAFAPGDYEVTFKGVISELTPDTSVTFDAASGAGSVVHGSQSVTQTNTESAAVSSFKFNIASQVTDLEIRANVPAGSKVKIESYEVKKYN